MRKPLAVAAWILAALAARAQEERPLPPPLRPAFTLDDRPYRTLAFIPAPANPKAARPDGVALAAGADSALRILDLQPQRPSSQLLPTEQPIEEILYDAAANLLVVRTRAFEPRLWNTLSWKPVRFALEDLDAGGLALRASWPNEDGAAPLVLANPSRGIRLWRIGRPRGTLRPILQIDLRDLAGIPLQGVTAAAWAGPTLLLGSDQGHAYHLPSLRPLLQSPSDVLGRLDRLSKTAGVLALHRAAITSLTPDAQAERFVTASLDGKIRLWKLSGIPSTSSPRKPIELPPEWEIPGHVADLTPDGRLLAVADSEAVAVYHAPTGVPLAWNPTRVLKGKVVRLRLSPDGTFLAALVCRCRDCSGAPGPVRPGGTHAGDVVVWK
jgi:WD40 repeat protein